jgi:hypothetical protein
VDVSAWSTAETEPGRHAFTDALAAAGITVNIRGYTEHATGTGPESPAIAYAECRVGSLVTWGAGRDTSVLTASSKRCCPPSTAPWRRHPPALRQSLRRRISRGRPCWQYGRLGEGRRGDPA